VFAAIALVVLTLVTLIVLSIYAWDTHTLARTSVEQINLTKQERDIRAMRDYHHAYDSFFKIQADLTLISKSLADGTFGTKYEGGTAMTTARIHAVFTKQIPAATRKAILSGRSIRTSKRRIALAGCSFIVQ